jgi:4-hydroxy-3-polyprenylbenzoate decarboxylase
MPKTGLPVPANSEIAFEGLIHPTTGSRKGPLGEWTGYYASGSDLEPAIRIDTLMYRDDPILVGAIPAVPPNDNTFYFGTYRCGAVWNQLEAAGIPACRACGRTEPAAAASCWWSRSRRSTAGIPNRPHGGGPLPRRRLQQPLDHRGRRRHRPTNFNDVVWAMCTRCDPRDQVDIIHGGWSSALDPMCYDTEHDRATSRVIIDACIPFRRKKTFPLVARSARRSTIASRKVGEGSAEGILSRQSLARGGSDVRRRERRVVTFASLRHGHLGGFALTRSMKNPPP